MTTQVWQTGKSRPREVKGPPTSKGPAPEPTHHTISSTCHRPTLNALAPVTLVQALFTGHPLGLPPPLQGGCLFHKESHWKQEEGVQAQLPSSQ